MAERREPMARPKVELVDVGKEFPAEGGVETTTAALRSVTLHVGAREVVSLVGPSGCGKSTVLNLVAGFMEPTAGRVLVDGAPVRGIAPSRLMVFQAPALFPWLSVLDNVTFGPRLRGVPAAVYGPLAGQIVATVGLTGFERHYPYQLSGGMRQRAQLARALVNEPEVLLLDEPFGALDAQTRLAMQEMLLRIWEAYHPTILFITHDVEEALFLSDRLYVLSARPGTIRRELTVPFGRPRDVALLGQKDFGALKAEILELLRTGSPPSEGSPDA